MSDASSINLASRHKALPKAAYEYVACYGSMLVLGLL
jgi:hypothetical protein